MSSYNCVASGCLNLILDSNLLSHIASCEASVKAKYPTSVEDNATVFCRFLLHDIILSPN